MYTFSIQGKTVSVYPARVPEAPVIYLNTFSQEEEQVVGELQKQRLPAFSLVSVSDLDWNRDMVPWDHPPVFQKGEPFTGGADAYLRLLTGAILPEAEKALPGPPCWRGLAGYSLAGLFAVYAIYQTDMFSRIASMSGSLWFPGMLDYIRSHPCKRVPDCIYLSLGDRESKTRNPLMRTVRENTEAFLGYCQNRGIRSEFQLNPGNHFSNPAGRIAAGIAWLLNQ